MDTSFKYTLSSITIDRPLVFLCGPHEDPALSRREKLLKFISDIKGDKTRLMPIIVDDLFENSFVKSNDLDLSLLEEIISAVSYKTYIFLDSMSTSYELGLFTNHFADNQVKVFLEKDFQTRGMNSIGGFILNSFSNIVEYSGTRTMLGRIQFSGSTTPTEIASSINDDFQNWASLKTPISFKKVEENGNQFGVFYVEELPGVLRFHLSLKTFFYILAYSYKESKENFDSEGISHLKEELYFRYLAQLKEDPHQAELILKKPKVVFCVSSFHEEKLIHHIVSILQRIEEVNKKRSSPYVIWTPVTFAKSYQAITFDLFSLVSDDSAKTKKILKHYYRHPEDFVVRKKILTSNKIREITTYSNNSNGRYLKEFHQKIVDRFSSLAEASEGAFAYKKGCSAKKCVMQHLDSISFLKLDIHHFFASISYRILLKKIYSLISGLLSGSPIKKIFFSEVRDVFHCCFVRWHLPIGFVTSPLLSDYYMHYLDTVMLAECQNVGIVYTRYADDFLISSSKANDPNIKNIEDSLLKKLHVFRLSTNDKKRFQTSFIENGSSIKFLGIVLSYQKKGPCRLSISKADLTSISKYTGRALRHNDRKMIAKAVGKIEYVRSVSEESYQKLIRTIFIKTTYQYDHLHGFPRISPPLIFKID